jgi:glycosyltransferase involved in cell wall biosynthesis
MHNHNRLLLYICNVDWYFQLHWLPRALAAKAAGYDVHLLTNITRTECADELANTGIILHDIPLSRRSRNPLHELSYLKAAYQAINHINPDLVHTITVKPNIYAGSVCRYLKIPVIMSITGRGQVLSDEKRSIIDYLVKLLYRYASKNAESLLLFENHEDRQFFLQQGIGNPNKLHVISGAGVDTNEYAFNLPVEKEHEPLTILFAARMLWNKGLQDLIEARRILRSRGKDIVLKVAGLIDKDNVDAISIKQIHQWADDGEIEWLGQRSDMIDLITSADVVALPTTYGEGVPRILIEAASVGRPLIATDVPGCRDIVHHEKNGFLVKPNSAEQLADAIERMTDYQVRSDFAQYGRNLAEQTFCQSHIIRETLSVYEQLLNIS